LLLRLSLAGLTCLAVLVLAGAALADASDPKQHFTKADQAKAAATVLAQNDLGAGWKGGARTPTSLKAPKCPAYTSNDSDLTMTGHAESLFSNGNGGVQVDSDVEVFRTARQAATRFARILQPRLGTCLRYDLLKSVAGTKGVRIGQVKRLPLPKVATHGAAFRVPLTVQNAGQSVTVDSDVLFLGQGPTAIYLNVVAPDVLGSQLTALEERLARALAARSKR
jgi:hypothetical protein